MKEDRSIQKNAFYSSLILTVVFWLFLLAFFVFAPPFQKKELYRPIQIILESPEEIPVSERPQIVGKKEEDALSKTVPSNAVPKEEAPSQAQNQLQNQAQENAAAQYSSSATASSSEKSQKNGSPSSIKGDAEAARTSNAENSAASKKADIKYKKSAEELLEEQFEATKDAQWDESVFESDSVNEAVSQSEGDSASVATETLSRSDALSGTAGTASPGEKGAVAKADNPSQGSLTEASPETLSSLQRILKATYTAPEENGVVSSVSVNAATDSEGSVSIEMTDKSTRILLDPKKPYIILSEESASLIDSSRTIMIEFVVLPSGTVPFSRINFIPSSLLPQAVQSEIREQISKWRFSTASSEALARLEYNIKKR